MGNYYRLDSDGKTPIKCGLMEWAKSNKALGHVVEKTMVGAKEVSTVFLGLDHDFTGAGPPILWETLVFPDCDFGERYTSHQDAVAGHGRFVAELRAKLS